MAAARTRRRIQRGDREGGAVKEPASGRKEELRELSRFPYEVEYSFLETIEKLRPKFPLAKSFADAHAAVVKLEVDMQNKIGILNEILYSILLYLQFHFYYFLF